MMQSLYKEGNHIIPMENQVLVGEKSLVRDILGHGESLVYIWHENH